MFADDAIEPFLLGRIQEGPPEADYEVHRVLGYLVFDRDKEDIDR
jgi:hypothetical protein